jgi:uncharacterized protein
MLALGGAAAATLAYATLVEPRWLRVARTTMHFRRLPAALEGLTIALITDLHGNRFTPRGLVRRVVERTNAERPDLIAITGDIAENEAALETTLDELSALRAPLGVYIVPGNHDYRDVGIERWHDAVGRRHALENLTNVARLIRVSGARDEEQACLCVVGVDDLACGRPRIDVLPPPHHRDFTILLAHQPDQAENVRRADDDVDLVLSGHTHGGQVRIPGFGAVVNSANRTDLYEAGVRRRPWTQVYTSRGIGTTHLPVRFMAPPEVSLLRLSSQARPEARWGGRGLFHRGWG